MSIQGIIPPKFVTQTHEMGTLKTQWKEFKAELAIYFLASGQQDMADEVKIAILQYQMGRHYQKVLANFGLTDEESKNYSTVVQKFDKYFEPKVLTASNIN